MPFQRKDVHWTKGTGLTLFGLGLLVTAAFAALFVYKPTFLVHLNFKVYDTLLRSTHSHQTTTIPIIVDIDEQSLKKFGQWPWPRYLVARLLDVIRELGAASIAMDMVFAERDRTSLGVLKAELERDLGISIPCVSGSSPFADNDAILADALAKGPFVLGYEFAFGSGASGSAEELAHPVKVTLLNDSGAPRNTPVLLEAPDVLGNLKQLAMAARASGFFNLTPDLDSITRRVPLLMAHQGRIYPSLALAALLVTQSSRNLTLKTQSSGEQILSFDGRSIPLDGNGRLLIHFRGPRKSFPYVSAADILNNQVPKGAFEGKIVFVGSSATGLKEFRPTPLDPVFPGVEIHATLVDNILKGDCFSRSPWMTGLELLLILTLGISSTLLFIRLRALWSFVFIVICSIGIWEGAEMAFRNYGIFISPLYPLMVLGGQFSLLNLMKYWREERKARYRQKQISMAQAFTIQCLASLVETRDAETGGHIMRTQQYVKALCEHLVSHPKFRDQLTPEVIELLYKATPLHDIGKVGMRDGILRKRGKLTEEEFEQMKKHTIYGRDVIINAQERLGPYEFGNLFLEYAKDVIYTHHEKWDGSGYPQGLKGEDIPISGRLMALADVYDALISGRVYKEGYSHEKAVQMIVKGRGGHFDPDIVDAFLQVEATFKRIALEFIDTRSEE
ncbi:MAG TPA: metal-dependent phosphohydrolase [Syntrophobacteraceae bacterium]|nr:metal-dependent phosphohydrolase [Syntrophobacteraceae bacterium]